MNDDGLQRLNDAVRREEECCAAVIAKPLQGARYLVVRYDQKSALLWFMLILDS